MAKTRRQFNREYYLRYREQILARRYGANRRRNGVRFGDYREAHRRYANTERGRQKCLERLYRFIEQHPQISEGYLLFVERMIKANERTVSLAAVI